MSMNIEHLEKERSFPQIADDQGLAVVVTDVDGQEISAANNNSICRTLYSSAEFAPRCAADCGRAFQRVKAAGRAADYECHAGLQCRAVPIQKEGRNLVAIVGRAFVRAANYKKATEKAINGEWKNFRPTEFFENILITSSAERIENVAAMIESPWTARHEALLELPLSDEEKRDDARQTPDDISVLIANFNREVASPNRAPSAEPQPALIESHVPLFDRRETSEWRSLFGKLMRLDYKQALDGVLSFISERYYLGSLVWLERRNGHLEIAAARGPLSTQPLKLDIDAASEKLQEAAIVDVPIVLRERADRGRRPRTLSLFPVVLGGDLRGAIAVEGKIGDEEKIRGIFRFCRTLGPQLEILRLRREVGERDALARAVRKFNESLHRVDGDDFWTRVTQVSAELLGAERASLLVKNERSGGLKARAAIGARINLFVEPSVGERVARIVIDEGEPVVVTDIANVAVPAAPAEWKYKTPSFISYPIAIGTRRLGVLNFTDRAGGEGFGTRDLDILHAIAPQIAVAIDRTALREKAI
ncbi:MAG: GAF domain-containing protein, partial [Acidobacteria bacterium]|nr:GAF domain-containing protein [Acidobacteriota bacterium]